MRHALFFALAFCAENWPQFRGPRADGTSSEGGAAFERNWQAPLPGPGHSSPIVWGDRIFLTAFEPDRTVIGAVLGRRGRLLVICLNRTDGKIKWQREAPSGTIEKTTNVNQPASPTPATDGQRLYVYFGSFGLLAYDLDGNPLWQHKLGPYDSHMGSGSSPVLSGGKLLLNLESDGPGFLLNLDPQTGKEIWRVPRRTRQAGYSTPMVWNGTIIAAGHRQVTAHQSGDGRELWTTPGLGDYVVPTPVAGPDLLYVTSNGPGGGIVIALNGQGTAVWRSSKGGAYVASPLLLGKRLYTVHQGGVVTCLDSATGRLIWQQRLAAKGDYYASPVSAGGLIYLLSEAGDLSVIADGDAFRLLRASSLGGAVYASPAVSRGVMLIRSNHWLASFRLE